MSSSYYKIPYYSYLGEDMSRVDDWLFVHEHHTSGVNTVYDTKGNIQFQWGGDCEGDYALKLAQVILGTLSDDDAETWDGTFETAEALTEKKDGD